MSIAAFRPSFLYYAGPSKPAALYENRFGSFGAVAKFLQGAGTALLAYSGAGAIAGPAGAGAPGASDFTTLDGFTQAILEGRLTGPAQLLAGAFLFLAAGRRHARMLGLFAGLALVILHAQGVTLAEMLSVGGDIVMRLVNGLIALAWDLNAT
jgi:hypothetical protein